MSDWRLELRAGPENIQPRIALADLVRFATSLLEAVRVGVGGEKTPNVDLVGFKEGSNLLVVSGDQYAEQYFDSALRVFDEAESGGVVDADEIAPLNVALRVLRDASPDGPMHARLFHGRDLVRDVVLRSSVLERLQLSQLHVAEELRSAGNIVRLTGKITEIDERNNSLKVSGEGIPTIGFRYDPLFFHEIDAEYRWKWVHVEGVLKSRRTAQLEGIRLEAGEAVPTIQIEDAAGRARAFLSRLDELLRDVSVRRDGWDTPSSKAIDDAAVARVRQWAESTFAHILLRGVADPPRPWAVPTSRGGIQLEWAAQGRHLELEFLGSGPIEYLLVEGGLEDERNVSLDEARKVVVQFIAATSGEEPHA